MELPERLSSLIKSFFEALQREEIRYAVLRNFEKLPFETSRDIDIYIKPSDYPLTYKILNDLLKEYDYLLAKETSKFKYSKIIITDSKNVSENFFQIDFFMNENLYGNDFFEQSEWEFSTNQNNISIPSKFCYLSSLLMTSTFHGDIKKRYIEILRKEFKDQTLFEEINIFLKKKIGASMSKAIIDEINQGNTNFPSIRLKSRLIFTSKRFLKNPLRSLVNHSKFIWFHMKLLINPPGKFIVFIGPDGSGKTSTISDVRKKISPELFTSVVSFHGKVPILPELKDILRIILFKRKSDIKDTKNHPDHRHIESIKAIKFKYVYITYYAFNQILMLPLLYIWKWRNRIIIGDRYFYDYFFQNGFNWEKTFLLKLLSKIIPRPDHTIYLKNTPEVLYSRKREITIQEISRQLQLIDKFKGNFHNLIEVNTDKDINFVSKEIISKII